MPGCCVLPSVLRSWARVAFSTISESSFICTMEQFLGVRVILNRKTGEMRFRHLVWTSLGLHLSLYPLLGISTRLLLPSAFSVPDPAHLLSTKSHGCKWPLWGCLHCWAKPKWERPTSPSTLGCHTQCHLKAPVTAVPWSNWSGVMIHLFIMAMVLGCLQNF